MAGKKGMYHSNARKNSLRLRVWRAMRIMEKGFTLHSLCCAVEGASYVNVRKFVSSLANHGIVRKNGEYTGGRPGEFQSYRLVKGNGPKYPTVCDLCGQPIGSKFCLHEKEREKEKEREREVIDDAV